jgi:hypothetical protein
MNQEQVKEKLLILEEVPDFDVIFSGKESKRVDGLYKPELREIIIHNKNMKTDDEIMYTAIHEFAHHVHFCHSLVPVSNRAHTNEFWSIFHNLLRKAEDSGIYSGGFEADPELKALTDEIREKYIKQNGKEMLAFGKCLLKAMDLCKQRNLRFEDYLDRILLLPRDTAMSIINIARADVNPDLGYENMKIIAGIRNPEKRQLAEKQMAEGQTSVMIKGNTLAQKEADPVSTLQKEKIRLERAIESMQNKISKIEQKIKNLES